MTTEKSLLEKTPFDRNLNIAAIFALFIAFAIPAFFMAYLPERIPVHFNSAGEPDRMGQKYFLLIVPFIGLALYVLLTSLERSPQMYNYPVKITPENKLYQYALAARFIRLLKTVLIWLFALLTAMLCAVAFGSIKSLGIGFIPFFFVAVAAPIVWYFRKAFKLEQPV